MEVTLRIVCINELFVREAFFLQRLGIDFTADKDKICFLAGNGAVSINWCQACIGKLVFIPPRMGADIAQGFAVCGRKVVQSKQVFFIDKLIYKTDEHGKYTGEVVPMWDGVSKKKAMLELAEQYDLDLSQCWSYGDTNGDLTMFENTGYPTAINPTRELLLHIQQEKDLAEKMRVIVERKDVIYNIDIKSLHLA